MPPPTASTPNPIIAEEKVFNPVSGGNTPSPLPSNLRGGMDRILNQIEGAADYYSPDTYRNLLTYYSSVKLYQDPNQDFVPVSQTKPNPKMFVVGIIPPSARITGRTLDRSASVAAVTGSPVEQLDFSTPAGVSSASGTGRGAVSKGKVGSVVVADPESVPHGADLPPTFWNSYVQMCQRLKVDPLELGSVIYMESGFNPAAQNFASGRDRPPEAQGLNQLIRGSAQQLGMDQTTWNNLSTLSAEDQLPWVEEYFSRARVAGKSRGSIYAANFGGFRNPDGSLYASEDYINSRPDADQFPKPKFQQDAFAKNRLLSADGKRITKEDLSRVIVDLPPPAVRQQIRDAQGRVSSSPPPKRKVPPPPPGTNDTNDGWVGQGSANASAAKKEEAKVSNTDLNQTDLGKRFLAAQSFEAKLTAAFLDQMQNTPPLRLLVNPQSFKINSEKVVSDGNWTRNGPIIEHWGDQQDKIEANGKLAAFLAIDANSPDINFEGGPGLTRVARQYSASYHNFMALYLLYRNNGYLFTSGLDNADSKGFFSRLSLVGSIYLYYDSTLYIGSFDSFNITEEDTAPYTVTYSFQFVARATFLLDRPDEYDYGAKKLFYGDSSLPTTQEAMTNTILQGTSEEGNVALPEGIE